MRDYDYLVVLLIVGKAHSALCVAKSGIHHRHCLVYLKLFHTICKFCKSVIMALTMNLCGIILYINNKINIIKLAIMNNELHYVCTFVNEILQWQSSVHVTLLPSRVFSSNPPCKGHILGHQCYSLGVNGTKVAKT